MIKKYITQVLIFTFAIIILIRGFNNEEPLEKEKIFLNNKKVDLETLTNEELHDISPGLTANLG
jgi:hypothetical protein